MDRLPSNLPINGHSFRRVEVLTGEPKRRQWSEAEKARIVAESLVPGAVASEVALRHGLHRNQIYGWRREFRAVFAAEAGASGAGVSAPDFTPVVMMEEASAAQFPGQPPGKSPGLDIIMSGMTVRAEPGIDLTFLAEIILMLKRLG